MKKVLFLSILLTLFLWWSYLDGDLEKNDNVVNKIYEEKVFNPKKIVSEINKKKKITKANNEIKQLNKRSNNDKKIVFKKIKSYIEGFKKDPTEVLEKYNEDSFIYADTLMTEESLNSWNELKSLQIKIWSNEIAYTIDEELPEHIKENIYGAIDEFNNLTNVTFVEEDSSEAIFFTLNEKDSNCYSYLGKQDKKEIQPIYLSENCSKGNISHEIMHALGFIHEHTRGDRDDFVNIYWENIDEEYYSNFMILRNIYDEEVYPFDYNSIMIYNSDSFSINGNPTLLDSHEREIKKGSSLSDLDIEKINSIYK